jgi:hypothetical protein
VNRRAALRSLLAVPAVGRVEVATVTEADVIAITCAGPVSQEDVAKIRHETALAFPGCRVLVLLDGATLSVVRPPT